jgi:hypothetical protein
VRSAVAGRLASFAGVVMKIQDYKWDVQYTISLRYLGALEHDISILTQANDRSLILYDRRGL